MNQTILFVDDEPEIVNLVRAVLRRVQPEPDAPQGEILRAGDLVLDRQEHSVTFAQAIISAHAGHVGADSHINQGTQIKFTLPLQD
jgi:CheY-like chemotaxis protein